jgi:hypothetical protein
MSAECNMSLATEDRAGVSELTAHLQKHAGRYLPTAREAPAHVQLVRSDVRAASSLHRFIVLAGGHERIVLVKIPRSISGSEAGNESEPLVPDRPRISPVVEFQDRLSLEYDALARIHRHFSQIDDPRFGSIQVFELLPQYRAIVMEAVDQPDLRKLVIREGRRRSSAGVADLHTAFGHAGAWLHSFHTIDTEKEIGELQPRRDDFIEFSRQLTEYLSRHLGQRSFFSRVDAAVAAQSHGELPDELPLGLGHGDFAMRNILVGPAQRVTALDSLGRYRVPVFRDVGYFLANLNYSRLPALGQGAFLHPARGPALGRSFVRGYFNEETDVEGALRLYEVQSLLEKWSSVVWSRSRRSGASKHAQSALLSAFFRTLITAKLRYAAGR